MSTRFDFEQQIMTCWNVVEDIKALREIQNLRTVSADEMDNALLGLQTMYQFKFEQLFDMFETLIREKQL